MPSNAILAASCSMAKLSTLKEVLIDRARSYTHLTGKPKRGEMPGGKIEVHIAGHICNKCITPLCNAINDFIESVLFSAPKGKIDEQQD